ncbi:MAG: hypothetical protein AAF399_08710 [Bacteroidota bacterium]
MKAQHFHQPFKFHLMQAFQQANEAPLTSAEMEHFLEFLLERNLISEPSLKQFTLAQEMSAILESGYFPNKTQAVQAIAQRYDVSESSLWQVVKTANRPR